jgi:hypothetical protein
VVLTLADDTVVGQVDGAEVLRATLSDGRIVGVEGQARAERIEARWPTLIGRWVRGVSFGGHGLGAGHRSLL